MTELSMIPTTAVTPSQNHRAQLSPAEIEKAREFEAMFLSQFVDEMMSTVDMGAATGGRDTEMWRSFLSEAIAGHLVDQGGLGLAQTVEQKIAAYKRS